MASAPVVIRPKPGIQRDGTRLDAQAYIDGQWTRFHRGLPEKMGGYRNLGDTYSGIVRGMHGFTKNAMTYVHGGSSDDLERVVISSGAITAYANRTPSGFATSALNQWQFDMLYDPVVGNAAQIIAHATPSSGCLCTTTETPVYIGDATGTAQLTAITGADASGGILVMGQYLTSFGTDGLFKWSVINSPSDFAGAGSGEAYVAKQQIVRGLTLRGGPSASPSALLWSADALTRAYFTGGSTVWGFDTLSENTTILAKRCPIEYDGLYFWPGSERFFVFNGTVREVPNEYSIDWFYDNMNLDAAGKSFAFRNSRHGEIWWCFPYQDATEPSHAVVYNVRENIWYDTILPNGGRSAAISPQVYRWPLMAGVAETSGSTYKLWQHETGADEIDGTVTSPVKAYIETNDLCLVTQPQGQDKQLSIEVIEPDFIQSGDMTVTVIGNKNARSEDVESESVTFPADATSPEEQIVKFKETRRQIRLRFESNTVGGDFQMGKTIAHIQPSGGTKTG